MPDWLVITADGVRAGRGVRGYTLAWFLRTYFGRRRVGVLSPEDFRREPIAADTVFIGLPSTFSPEEIERLFNGRYRRVVLFDYLDQQRLAWSPEQEPAFRAVSRHYLKPWLEHVWNYGLRMGMLPIRRSRRLSIALLLNHSFRSEPGRPGPGAGSYKHDVAFVGQPNDTRIIQGGEPRIIDQRYDWLNEIHHNGQDVNFWGGFTGGDPRIVARLKAAHGDFSHLYYQGGKLSFWKYFRKLQQSRVLLAPGGNAPWTYRHYECLYAGGVVVTIDFRQRDMLIPLPDAGVIHVPDNAPVVPYLREALELGRRNPNIGQQNIAHLEQYLRFGNYSRTRQKLIQRFVTQLG